MKRKKTDAFIGVKANKTASSCPIYDSASKFSQQNINSKSLYLVDVSRSSRERSKEEHTKTAWMIFQQFINRSHLFHRLSSCENHEKVVLSGAFFQATIVILLQALIFSFAKVESMDAHRKSYVLLFFFAIVGSLFQTIDGVLSASMTDLGAAFLLNVIIVIYASLQVSDVFNEKDASNRNFAAMATVSCVLLVIIVLADAAVLSHFYERFADSIYARIGSDPLMQRMYHTYKTTSAMSILLSLLNTIFILVQLLLYLPKHDPEMPTLVVILIVDLTFAILIRAMKHLAVIRAYMVWLLLLAAGYVFKIAVFDLRLCSFCEDVSNMLFLSFSVVITLPNVLVQILIHFAQFNLTAAINLIMTITALGLAVRCTETFRRVGSSLCT
eukprot:gene6994-7627_t